MKVLFAGLGGIGQRHLRNLTAVVGEDDLEILAYRVLGRQMVLTEGLTVEAESGLEERYAVTSFDDLDKALAEGPDIAFITNPSSHHVTTAQAAAGAGCHLFIEKPLAASLEGVESLIATVDAKGLVAFVAFQMRFHPGLRLLASVLEDDELGRVLGARLVLAANMPEWHPYEDYRDIYTSRRDLGGGVILSQIHALDYAQWLFGLPTRLFCIGGNLSTLEMDVEDTASIVMDCPGPGYGFPVHLYLDFVQRPPIRNAEVFGDEGRVEWDYYRPGLRVTRPDGTVESRAYPAATWNDLFVYELRHFLECVRSGAPPLVDLREGLSSLRMSLAAHESLATGEAVTVS